MNKLRIRIAYVLLFCLLLTVSSCSKEKEQTKPAPEDKFESVEPLIEELETSLITVMSRVDLIPYYEKQIAAKKKHEEEQKQTQPPAGGQGQGGSQGQGSGQAQGGQSSGSQGSGGGSSQGGQSAQGGQAPKPEEFKPEPITINDILLTEILRKELPEDQEEMTTKAEQIPENIELVWYEITTTINTLHEQWNDLSPKLKEFNVSGSAITDFENTLNELTIATTEKKYMDTLVNANKTTAYIPEFMRESKEPALSPLYQLKYLLRQIILDVANNDSTKANENMQEIKTQEDLLAPKLAEKKADDEAAKLKASIGELEKALQVKDINLIKVEGAVLSKNIATIKEAIKK